MFHRNNDILRSLEGWRRPTQYEKEQIVLWMEHRYDEARWKSRLLYLISVCVTGILWAVQIISKSDFITVVLGVAFTVATACVIGYRLLQRKDLDYWRGERFQVTDGYVLTQAPSKAKGCVDVLFSTNAGKVLMNRMTIPADGIRTGSLLLLAWCRNSVITRTMVFSDFMIYEQEDGAELNGQ